MGRGDGVGDGLGHWTTNISNILHRTTGKKLLLSIIHSDTEYFCHVTNTPKSSLCRSHVTRNSPLSHYQIEFKIEIKVEFSSAAMLCELDSLSKNWQDQCRCCSITLLQSFIMPLTSTGTCSLCRGTYFAQLCDYICMHILCIYK